MAEQHGRRGECLQEFRELGAIVGHADAGKLGVGVSKVLAMTDQVRRMARPAQALEHPAKSIEAPAAGRGAMQHHDVLSHAFSPCPRVSTGKPRRHIVGARSARNMR